MRGRTVYVLTEMFGGCFENVRVFTSKKGAVKAALSAAGLASTGDVTKDWEILDGYGASGDKDEYHLTEANALSSGF